MASGGPCIGAVITIRCGAEQAREPSLGDEMYAHSPRRVARDRAMVARAIVNEVKRGLQVFGKPGHRWAFGAIVGYYRIGYAVAGKLALARC